MQQLVRQFILKKLKTLIPTLTNQQIQLALSHGSLQMDGLEIAPQIIDQFLIKATINKFSIQLKWTQVCIEIHSPKIKIERATKPQISNSNSNSSTLPIGVQLIIHDLEINFLDVMNTKIALLQINLHLPQITAQLQELNIIYHPIQLEVNTLQFNYNKTVQIMLNCLILKQTNKQKIAKFRDIFLNESKNIYDKPLIKITIDKGYCYWNAHLFHSVIMNTIDLVTQFIQIPQKQQIRQTDLNNPDSLALQIEANRVKLYAMNRTILIGRISGCNVSVQIKVSKYIAVIIIEGKELCYQECSNYPHQMIVKQGFPLIMSDDLLIKIKVYDDYCPLSMIRNDLYNFVEIKLQKGTLQYLQQPFLRFLDWLIEQFISLIIKDFGVDTIPSQIVEQKLADHRFTEIKLQVDDIQLLCQPLSNSSEFIKLNCQQFTLHTDVRECRDRSSITIWETLLCMEAQDICIENIVPQKLQLEIVVSKCCFTQLYQMKQIDLDRTFKIDMKISSPQLHVSKPTYILVMQLLFNNILYDDTLDQQYLLNVTQPTPIQFNLLIDQIELNCEQELQLILHQLQLRFLRFPQQSQIICKAQQFVAYHKELLIIENTENIEYMQTNQSSGFKNIQIHIETVNGTLNLNWLFTAINFFMIDDTVQLVLPYDYNVLKPLNLELLIQNAEVFLVDKNFKAQGNLLLVFQKNQSQEVHHQLHTVFDDNTPSSCMKIESSELTLFVNENELKQVFQPISVQWKSQNFQCCCQGTHQFINESHLNLENMKLYLTIEQALQLSETIKTLIQSMWDANQFGDKWFEQYQIVSQSRKAFNIDHLEVWLMSFRKDSIVPIMTWCISSNPLILHQSYKKMLLSGNFKVEASYFNPLIGILEPVLEKFSFDLMFLRNKESSPNMHLQIEALKNNKFQQLNIVLHQNLISLLQELYQASKSRKRKYSNRRSDATQNEAITLYNIYNQSGYDLSITIDEQTLQISNGCQVDFNVKLSQIDVWRKYNRIKIEFQSLSGRSIKLNRIEQNTQQQFKIDRQQYFLHIDSHINELSRRIKIQGQLTIENCTLYHQQIEILNQNQIIWSKQLKINERITPPAELISDLFFIRFSLFNSNSDNQLSVNSLFHSEFTYLEIQEDDYFIILSYEETIQGIRLFKLNPGIIIHNSLPCSLSIIINQTEQSVAVNDSLQIYSLNLRTQIYYQIQLLEYQSKLLNKQETNDSGIELYNEDGSIIHILQSIQMIKGTLHFYFYPKICLINTTEQRLNFHTLNKQKRIDLALFNPNFTFLYDEPNILLSYKNYYSYEFNIKAIGDTSVEIKFRKESQFELLEFGINISLLETVKDLGLYSTIIEITPRYVIINQCDTILYVQQQDSYGTPFNIETQGRIAFHWADCRKEKMIAIKLKNTKWSEGIYLSDMRTIHFSLNNKFDENKNEFMRCIITKKKSTFFVTFLREQAPYKLINSCQQYHIRFAQICCEIQQIIPYNQIIEYSWTFPSLKPILVFNVTHEQDHCEFQLDLFKSDSIISQQINQNKNIHFLIHYEEEVKIITIKDKLEQIQINDQLQKLIYINLQMVTLSLIINQTKPQELNLISISNLEIGVQEVNRIMQYQFKIKFINIDNNYSYDALNQVLLTPQQFQLYLEQQNYAMDFKWALNKQHSNILMIEYFYGYIAPLELKLDQEYVQQLMVLRKALLSNKQELTVGQFSTPKFLFDQSGQYVINQNPYYEWMIVEIPPPSGNVYIKQLILPVLKLRFSFQTFYQQNQNFILNVLANSLDFAYKNIENAPITFKGVKMENIFDTQQSFLTLIKEHYKFALLKQFLPILGSVEIIGNPTAFLNRISTGVVDLIEKPIEAISLGPLELGLGVLQGASSLVKNTVAGAFYSVNKITGSIGNQISLLSFDEEYISSRRKFMQRKPTHLFQGVYFGLQALITGFGDGIVGFFAQPYQHGKRDGAAGMLRGSTIGVAGVIIKPLTGVFDAASKTAEGLTNTATYFDDHPNNLRMRHIRAFYEVSRYVKAYNEDDSFFLNYLISYNIILIDTFQLFDLVLKKNMHLIITQNLLFYINKNDGIKWRQPANSIRDYKLYQDENNPQISRLYLFFEKDQILKLKFQKVPYQDQINQKLQNMIELNQ